MSWRISFSSCSSYYISHCAKFLEDHTDSDKAVLTVVESAKCQWTPHATEANSRAGFEKDESLVADMAGTCQARLNPSSDDRCQLLARIECAEEHTG